MEMVKPGGNFLVKIGWTKQLYFKRTATVNGEETEKGGQRWVSCPNSADF